MDSNRKDSRLFFIKTLVLVTVFFLLLIFSGVSDLFNRNTQNFLTKFAAETIPDTNIVIIHINENDISSIGPWPIKRSYYALLINSLNEFKPRIIGLEVFLSARFVSQTVYDNLLSNIIDNAGNVVLGSIAGSISFNDGFYKTDSLSYPSSKLLNDNLKTGHLNYIENNGIKIPLKIKTLSETENAFSVVLAGNQLNEDAIEVNLHSSWSNFRDYSLLEYFSLYQDDRDSLRFLKDKIVIIGISDYQLASLSKSAYDDNVPGVALHAFAVDNILNERWFCNKYISVSSVIFIIFLIAVAFFIKKIPIEKVITIYISLFILFLLFSFIYLKVFYIKLAYAHFMIPLFILFITELVLYAKERHEVLLGKIAETMALSSILEKKENQLEKLQRELDVTGESGSEKLIDRIRVLKDAIKKLKKNEDDQTAVVTENRIQANNFHGIVYRSKAMASVIDIVKRVAPEDANILILGESGTGKELTAKAIHILSKRNNKSFITVNCGALSDNLLESELFGHIRGAFTGAVADKTGRFEAADEGTIFLDEIAETSENFQVKLLRVLQSGEFEKVGSSKTQRVNVRVIAATNKNLDEAITEKKFREDLYYRLNIIKVELPPLRKRKEDIEVLAKYFIKKESPDFNISLSVQETILDYHWNGNVRELEAIIKRACIFAKSSGRNLIQLSDLPKEIIKDSVIDFEDLVLESLRNKKFSHSSMSETARELGNVNRTLVAENFRGAALKTIVENNFNLDIAVDVISGTDESVIKEKVKNKIETFMQNIENDVKDLRVGNFELAKSLLSSKYKNLPRRFHFYLDEVIKHYL